MNDIIKTYQARFQRNRHTFRRYAALLLALAMITTLFVNWQLHGVGISMTADYQCGEVEHTHTASCYTKMLVCDYNEGDLENPDEVAAGADTWDGTASDTTTGGSTGNSDIALYSEPQVEWVPHEHTDDCYTDVQVLTCMEEEHVHDDDCFDPEDGSLICNKFEHTHDDYCYTTERELTCGLEEGELVEQEVEPTQSAELFAMAVAQPVAVQPVVDTVEPVYHHHTDACYEEVLTCPFPEHHHTVNCLSDPYADVETEEEWLEKTDTTLDGLWTDDLLRVAQSQLGYEQSEKNFRLDGEDQVTVRHYTRYGQSYGNPYAEWDVMFLAYCLKYAQIPQSAIPQEASVLALRSSMKKMPWFQDVESTEDAALDIAPGDIVIYEKQATRTVAVETTQTDTTDTTQTGTASSTEAENSIIATMPADSSAAMPVDVGDFVLEPTPAKTDTPPQTTTATDTVDTVGIVEEIDDDTGTLTVISGDVDGKVAKVELAMSKVKSMISVTTAQVALDGQDGTAVQPDAAASAYKDYFTETKNDGSQGGITDYIIEVNNIKQGNETELTEGQTANLTFKYKIAADVLSKTEDGKNVLHYKLPAGLEPPTDIKDVDIFDKTGKYVIGKQNFYTDGTTELIFDKTQNYVDIERQFEGGFAYDWKYTNTTTTTQDEIRFPGSDTTIKLKKQQDLDVQKEAVSFTEENGKLKLHYMITVSTTKGWSTDDIFVEDTFSVTNSTTLSDPEIKNFTLKKYKADSKEDTTFTSTANPTFTKTSDANKWSFKVENLGKLEAGEKYVLEYDVELKNTAGRGYQDFTNSAKINDNKSVEVTKNNPDHVQKEGKYDETSHTVTWTVTVNNPFAADLNGDTIVDALGANDGDAKIQGNIKLYMTKDADGNQITDLTTPLDEFTPSAGEKGFTYTFDSSKLNNNTKGQEYQFKYTSTVPDDKTEVSNHVDYTHRNSTYDAGETTIITDNKWNVTKKANQTTLTESTTYTGMYEAEWKIEAQFPKTFTQYDLVDKIKSDDTLDHFTYTDYLKDQIEQNLKVTYLDNEGNEQTLSYNELATYGITTSIRYYNNTDWMQDGQYGSSVAETDKNTKVRSFILTIDPTGCSLKLQKLSLTYKTLVDDTNMTVGTTKKIYNYAADQSAEYQHFKPSTEIRIIKGSWNADGSRAYGNYGGTSKGNSINYDGMSGIGYQVVLDLSSLSALDQTMTLTDTLDAGVEYVPNSTSIVFGKANSLESGSNAWKDENLPTTDNKTYSTKTNAAFFEPTVTKSTDLSKEGDTLTFEWKWADTKINFAKLKADGYVYLCLRFKATIKNDNRWESPKLEKIRYNNTITCGEVSAECKTDVYRNLDKLKKSSEQITTVKNESRVRYTLEINPVGLMLGNDDKITLQDTLTVVSQGVQAKLDMDSIKLYSYPKKDGDQPLPATAYEVQPPTQGVNSQGQYTYTMTITLDNATPYVLVYDYTTDAKSDVTLSNEAELAGKIKAYTNQTYVGVGGMSWAGQTALTIHKVDSRSAVLPLEGAKFTLQSYDKTSKTWKDLNADLVTNGKGELTFNYVGDSTGMNPKEEITHNVLYRLQETEAPSGYQLDNSYHYFLYRDMTDDTITTDQAAYTAAVGDDPTDVPAWNATTITCYHSDTAKSDMYVKNVATDLVIRKKWQDENGNVVQGSDAPKDHVTVKLYRHDKTATTKDPDNDHLVDTITLTKAEDWTTTVKNLDPGYLYYIVEEGTSSSFEVIDGTNNKNGVDVGNTLEITNKATGQQDYELPSTGGTGTLPFTAVGGTMMLAALVYGVRRKRRHEGRAD